MKILCLLFFLCLSSEKIYAQTYFDEIVERHKMFLYINDSITLSSGLEIPVSRDSLILINHRNQTIKRYWEIDSNGKMINLFFEISRNRLFVIEQLDTDKRECFLYKKRGKRKVVMINWIESQFEKQKKILTKPKKSTIKYFNEGLTF